MCDCHAFVLSFGFVLSAKLCTDSKNTSEEESKQAPPQPVHLVRSGFQKYKPNLIRAVGRKELQLSANDREKKPEAEQFVLQKDESANIVIVSLIKNICFAFKNTVPSCMFYFMKLI